MNKNRFLLTAFIFSAMLAGAACNPVRETAIISAGVQSVSPSPLPITSPAAPTPTLTTLPSPTWTPLPADLPPASPTAPAPTSTPFLPANLAIISPQNAAILKPVAELAEQGASVVAYSPDSRRIAAGLFRSNVIKIWDLSSGQDLFSLSGHVDPRIISYLAFSPDGSRLASAAQGWYAQNDSLILWDAVTGRELQRYDGVLGAISPDWRLAALTQRERDQGATLVLSDLTSGEEIHTLTAPSDIYGISFSPEGQRVAAKMYHVFQDLFAFWSTDSGKLDLTLYDWLGFSFSPDGRFIAALVNIGSGSEKGELNIYDATTFKWIKTLSKEADALWYSYPAFSSDGQVLAASASDQVILWDTQAWKRLVTLPTSGPTSLAFSPDGRLLAISIHASVVQLWGVEGGE
jgi:WD40 repeat protein